jgi:hypothetical protein
MSKQIKFPSEAHLRKLFDIEDVHYIKVFLKDDFWEELKQYNIDNPDIGIDKNGLIILADPRDRSIFIETKMNYKEYKDSQ